MREQGSNARNLKIQSLVMPLIDWYLKNARALPWRNTSDPYAIWVSEIMLQQTQVKTVIPFWERWMQQLPTVEALAQADLDRVLKLWEGLGYYRRVRNMQEAARQMVASYRGVFPNDYVRVLALPGIGRYTAGAICSIAFDKPTAILDGNVTRVLTRVYGIQTDPKESKTLKRLWKLSNEWVWAARPMGKGCCSAVNQGLMELGATICTPSAPQCEICPLRGDCVALKKKLVDRIPATAPRAAVTHENRIAFVIQDKRDRVLLRQRPAGGINAQLWEFPNELSTPGLSMGSAAFQAVLAGILPASLRREIKLEQPKFLLSIKHSITRYRITLNVYQTRIADSTKLLATKTDLIPYPIHRLHELAFPSAHRRVVRHLQHLSSESGRAALSKK